MARIKAANRPPRGDSVGGGGGMIESDEKDTFAAMGVGCVEGLTRARWTRTIDWSNRWALGDIGRGRGSGVVRRTNRKKPLQ